MRSKQLKIISVVGARPNFVKISPLIREMTKYPQIQAILVHTGQHYDRQMSGSFFRELGIKPPKINLQVGSQSQTVQTAKIMIGLEKIFIKERPDLVLLVGDVNSTVAASLTAAKLNIPIAHVEAGLRSYDRTMPEEINRLITDQLSSLLFTTESDAFKNLVKEGVDKRKIFFVGNIMIDSLYKNLARAKKLATLKKFKIKPRKYCLLTLHRPSNVDEKKSLERIIKAVGEIQKSITVIWPIHPRSLKMIRKYKIDISKLKNLIIISPASYLNFLNLMLNAKFVMTDSGGIQEETTALSIPCLTLRNNTERPVTIYEGTNILAGINPQKIIREANKIIRGKNKKGHIPKYWDGKTARRIIKILLFRLSNKKLSNQLYI